MQKRTTKAQAVIEYLTTYGWLIIIVAGVLVALYALGVFRGTSTARANPGSCSVYRPNGPGTIQYVSLVGVCDGELPEYISRFSYTGPLDFINSNVTVYSTEFMPKITNTNLNKMTMTAWIYTYALESEEAPIAYGQFTGSGPWNGIYPTINQSGYCNSGLYITMGSLSYTCVYSNPIPKGQWMFLAMEYNGFDISGYLVLNGKAYYSSGSTVPFAIPAHSSTLLASPWNGTMTNIQLYNTSLSQNDLYALYDEGLGGTPIKLQYLVGWWPLNGNLNDYSGNQNNGYAYNSAGISGAYSNNYTAP